MEPITDADIPDFRISNTEIPYLLWKWVYRYGDAPFYTQEARYVYDRAGVSGSMRYGTRVHSQEEPVTDVRLYDVLAWCNTMSEIEGRKPCYYTDPECTQIFRNQHLATRGKYAEHSKIKTENPKYEIHSEPKIYVKWSADGFRLPTVAEWTAAAKDAPSPTIGDGTQPVGSGENSPAGLYAMLGNVWELVWTFGDTYDPTAKAPRLLMGGSFQEGDPLQHSASPFGDKPHDRHYSVGFRVVQRSAGADKPALGDVPATDGLSKINGLPAWRVSPETKTAAKGQGLKESPLEMVRIAGGFYPRPAAKGKNVLIYDMEMGKTEVSYRQWRAVFDWAVENGYEFTSDGHPGSLFYLDKPHGPDEPVTWINHYDMMIWLNAASELEGNRPVYYADEAMTEVYRKAFKYRALKLNGREYENKKDFGRGGKFNYRVGAGSVGPWLFTDWKADGYRLPTNAAWEYAASAGKAKDFPHKVYKKSYDKVAWHMLNSGGTTHPVGQKSPNPNGLYDVFGNVKEWMWSGRIGGDKRVPLLEDLNNPKDDPSSTWKGERVSGRRGGQAVIAGGSWHWGFGIEQVFYPGNVWYMADVGFRAARSVKLPVLTVGDKTYIIVGPKAEEVRKLKGQNIKVKGVISERVLIVEEIEKN